MTKEGAKRLIMAGFASGRKLTGRDVFDKGKELGKQAFKDPKAASGFATDFVDKTLQAGPEAVGYAVGAAPAMVGGAGRAALAGVGAAYSAGGKMLAGDGPNFSGRLARDMKSPRKAIAGAGITAAGAGYAAYSTFNYAAQSAGAGGLKQRQVMMSRAGNRDMAMADAVAIRNPQMMQMRDVDGAYDYMGANRSSNAPLTQRQAREEERLLARSQRRRRRMEPGMYNDGGNLVFALNDLRRGGY